MGMEFPKNRRKADDSYHALTSSAGGVFLFWLPHWYSWRVHNFLGILPGSGASLGAGASARLRGVCQCIRDLVDSGSVCRPLSSPVARGLTPLKVKARELNSVLKQ